MIFRFVIWSKPTNKLIFQFAENAPMTFKEKNSV